LQVATIEEIIVYVCTYTGWNKASDGSGTFVSKFGSNGTGDGQFQSPQGIAIDSSGNIYVADKNNNRIQKFNSSGVFQSKFGTSGSGTTQFDGINKIAKDSSGNIFITDVNNKRVVKYIKNF